MTRAIDTGRIGEKTGREWPDWIAFLDGKGARELPHKDIARMVRETGEASGWWAQTIAVAYEQHIGRRAPGEMSGGGFQCSVSKTLPGSMDDALGRWLALMQGRAGLREVPVTAGPEVSRTEKWRYWRAGLADGSRVTVTIFDKPPGKAGLAVQHEKLASPEKVAEWRGFWRAELTRL